MITFSKEVEASLKRRGEMFRSLPVEDWHQIIAFETIVRNYMNMKKILKENEENEKNI